MGTIRQEAEEYSPSTTLNIAELSAVPIDDFEVLEKTSQDSEGKDFTYKYVVIDGKEYRIPNSVLEEIQKILKIKPEVKTVKVNKTGEGLKTRYSVDVIN